MSLSSISSTRYPQITPVIFETFGFICGAWAKKVSKSLSFRFVVAMFVYYILLAKK